MGEYIQGFSGRAGGAWVGSVVEWEGMQIDIIRRHSSE